jgi:serine/threonine protein kinase
MPPDASNGSSQRIDGWDLIEQIGSGGNAVVWRAKRGNGEAVALKILKDPRRNPERYERFRIEVDTLRMLTGTTGVLPLLDASVPASPSGATKAWMAMPLATPIQTALAQRPGLDTVAEAIGAIADTLAELQRTRGLYHRDIKPLNLYLWNGTWSIGDFGLVALPDKAELTAPGTLLGPKYYLAPELLNRPAESDPAAADVYAMAKTLWVLATGQNYPMPGFLSRDHEAFRISSYVSGEQVYLLDALVERSTGPEPKHRPTMRQFADELRAWVESSRHPAPVLSNLADLRTRIAPVIRRHVAGRDRRATDAEHLGAAILDVETRVGPIVASLEDVCGLSVDRRQKKLISNLPDIYDALGKFPHVAYDGASYFVRSPTADFTNAGSGIALQGGLILVQGHDGRALVAAGYGVTRRGFYEWRPVWSDLRFVPFNSAQELVALQELVAGLGEHLAAAISAFAEELDQHIP